MPLARYEIRNEYSLANPDLYRAAAKDDPEGLLEGVAMAGLVGIVRQLGDLAEFAAEVFHDLNEDVLATAARGHELLMRVQQLEAELPLVEKMMLTETAHVKLTYNPGILFPFVFSKSASVPRRTDLIHKKGGVFSQRLVMIDGPTLW